MWGRCRGDIGEISRAPPVRASACSGGCAPARGAPVQGVRVRVRIQVRVRDRGRDRVRDRLRVRASLRDLEAAPLPEQHVLEWHAHVLEEDLHVAW